MTKATSEQLRFPTVDGLSVRANFDGGALSSDFGALLLAGVDRQTGLTQRLASLFQRERGQVYYHTIFRLSPCARFARRW